MRERQSEPASVHINIYACIHVWTASIAATTGERKGQNRTGVLQLLLLMHTRPVHSALLLGDPAMTRIRVCAVGDFLFLLSLPRCRFLRSSVLSFILSPRNRERYQEREITFSLWPLLILFVTSSLLFNAQSTIYPARLSFFSAFIYFFPFFFFDRGIYLSLTFY